MTRPRSEFKTLLDSIDGLTVYGQAPTNTKLVYPCAIFVDDDEFVVRADNIPYDITDRYTVTVIETDPNRPMAKAIRQLPMCSLSRRYEADKLIHTVYQIYF